MVPGLSANARLVSALVLAVGLVIAAYPVVAGEIARYPIADEAPYDSGAGADAEGDSDQPAQRAPEAEEPSEDGTDGADRGNSAEPPPGCMFRDGPLELVV